MFLNGSEFGVEQLAGGTHLRIVPTSNNGISVSEET